MPAAADAQLAQIRVHLAIPVYAAALEPGVLDVAE